MSNVINKRHSQLSLQIIFYIKPHYRIKVKGVIFRFGMFKETATFWKQYRVTVFYTFWINYLTVVCAYYNGKEKRSGLKVRQNMFHCPLVLIWLVNRVLSMFLTPLSKSIWYEWTDFASRTWSHMTAVCWSQTCCAVLEGVRIEHRNVTFSPWGLF